MAITQNRSKGHAVTVDIANANYQLADFAVPNSSIETVTGVCITKIIWTGDWTIKRGATVVFQTANNEGHWDLSSMGISLNTGSTANLTVNTTSSSATLILGVSKTSSTTANTW